MQWAVPLITNIQHTNSEWELPISEEGLDTMKEGVRALQQPFPSQRTMEASPESTTELTTDKEAV